MSTPTYPYINVTGTLVHPSIVGDKSITAGLPQLGLGTINNAPGVSEVLSGGWGTQTNLELSGNTDPSPHPGVDDSLWSSGAGSAVATAGAADTIPASDNPLVSLARGITKFGGSISTILFSPRPTSTAYKTQGQALIPSSQPVGAKSNSQMWITLVIVATLGYLILNGGE